MRVFRSIFCATVALAAAAPALAQTSGRTVAQEVPVDDEFNRDTVTVGLAGAWLPDYEGSDDYRLVPGPAAIGSVKGYNFSLIGNRASVDLIANQPGPTWDFQLGPVAVVNFNRTSRKNIDDERVKALGKIDTAIELGGYVGIGKTGVVTSPYDRLSVSLSYRHDVAGAHDSGIWQPTINYLTPLSRKAAVTLVATAEHVSSKFGRTYFSVTPAQALTSGLPAYSAGKGWKNYTFGLAGVYSIKGDLLNGWKLVAGGTYKRMLNDYGDSPLVSVAGSRNQWLGAVGVAYTF